MNEGLLAISGASYQGSSVEVELFSDGCWYEQQPFPEEKSFDYYSTATYQNLLYVFGEFYKKLQNLPPMLLANFLEQNLKKSHFRRPVF